MSLKDHTLQKQLERAKSHLSEVEQGLSGAIPKKQALWRRANARVQQIEGRLGARSGRQQPAAESGEAEGKESGDEE
jgi:hypothetical protein